MNTFYALTLVILAILALYDMIDLHHNRRN